MCYDTNCRDIVLLEAALENCLLQLIIYEWTLFWGEKVVKGNAVKDIAVYEFSG